MKLVVLGGGFCGITVAKSLEKHEQIDVTLVDKEAYFEYTPGVLKPVFDSEYVRKIVVPFDDILKESRILCEKIKRVTPENVETESKKIDFDRLVVSTGIDYPIFLENRKNVFTLASVRDAIALNNALSNAKSVVIVGGGLIGVEIAGEIATKRSDIKVFIIHSKKRLMERNPHEASVYAQNFLEDRGVELILGEKVVENKSGAFVTDKGRSLEADIGIWSTGISWNPSYMENFESSIFSERGALKVDKYLRLREYPDIFVGGDVTSIEEEKTAQNAKLHSEAIVKNLKRELEGDSLVPYRSKKRPMVISLGDRNGILVYDNIVLSGVLPGLLKWIVQYWNLSQFDGLL